VTDTTVRDKQLSCEHESITHGDFPFKILQKYGNMAGEAVWRKMTLNGLNIQNDE